MTTTVTYLPDVFPLPGGETDWPIPGSIPLEYIESIDVRALERTSLMIAATLTDQNSQVHLPFEPFPGGETDWPVTGEFSVIGATAKHWLGGHIGVTTTPDDDPANQPIAGNLVGTIGYKNSLFAGVDPLDSSGTGPQTESGYGAIKLNDPSGALDYLTDLSLDGGLIEIYRGRADQQRRDWTKIAAMTSMGVLYDGDTKDIRVRDAGWKLDRSEIQPIRYGGGGGIDGDSSLRGACKPYAVGYNFRVPLLIINATLLIGQVSNSSIYQVIDVQDGGQSLTLADTPDYPTYEALAAATALDIPAGRYATCLAYGLIRLGAQPTKQVTVELVGDNDTLNGKTRPITRADIVRRIVCGLGYYRLDNARDLDSRSFVDMDDYFSDECGFFWNQPITKAAALAEVMAGVAGYAAVRFDGKLTIGAAKLPTGSPYLSIVLPAQAQAMPRLLAYSAPRLGTYIGWSRNYVPQTRDQLQGGVPEATALIYSNPLRVEGSLSGANASIWPTSQIVTVNGGFRYQAAATVEASRQQSIFGVRRERWGMTVPMDQFSPVLGRQVDVSGWSRYNFNSSRSLRCVALSVNDTLNLTLELWG